MCVCVCVCVCVLALRPLPSRFVGVAVFCTLPSSAMRFPVARLRTVPGSPHMRESCVSLNWVLEELCSVLKDGTLVCLVDACQTTHRGAGFTFFDPARVAFHER